MPELIAAQELNRLKWRCRRGLLENDLFIQDFFARHESCLSSQQIAGLSQLMELADNELLDLLLRRGEPQGPLNRPEVCEVLAQMRRPLMNFSTEGTAP